MIDRDDAWLDVVDDLIWTEDSQSFTWVSEQDGWRHAYLVDRDSGEMTLITDAPKRWTVVEKATGLPIQVLK